MITRLVSAVLLLIFTLTSFAGTEKMSSQNLQGIQFTDRQYVLESAKSLLNTAGQDAYLLSLPLMLAAQLGEGELYQQALTGMRAAMDKRVANGFTAWLYGRILFAATSMGASDDQQAASQKLKEILDAQVDALDAFTAWALAYYAAMNTEAYQAVRQEMQAAVKQMAIKYIRLRDASGPSESDVQTARSNALWAWVMLIQAAANAGDREAYDAALSEMKGMMGAATESRALSMGLLRTSASNDYPAWALAIVQLAAQRMQDRWLFDQVDKVISESIREARQANAMAEAALAIVNHELAVAGMGGRAEIELS